MSTADAVQLAALVDGRLPDAEREALLQRISRSPELLELLGDVSAAVGHLEHSAAAVTVPRVEAPARRRWLSERRNLLVIAASVVAVAVIPFTTRQLRHGDDLTAELVAQIDLRSARQPVALERPWSTTRGREAAITDEQRAVRIGSLGVDLAVRLTTGDTAAATVLEEIEKLVSDLPASGPTIDVLRRAGSAIRDGGAGAAAAAEDARRAAEKLVDEDHMQFGAWVESARIAAARRDWTFFRSRAFADATSRVVRSARFSPELAAVVREVSAPLPPSDWNGLETTLANLARSASR